MGVWQDSGFEYAIYRRCEFGDRQFYWLKDSRDKIINGRHHLNQMIQVNLSSNMTLKSCTSFWYNALKRTQHHFYDILAQEAYNQSINVKISDQAKLNWVMFYIILDQQVIKSVEGHGRKEREFHMLERQTSEIKCGNLDWILEEKKDPRRQIGKIWISSAI